MPTFFFPQAGWFPVQTTSSAPADSLGALVYRTQDGGQTWSSTPAPFAEVAYADFIDLVHAVTIDSRGKDLLATSDGWHHWTMTPLPTTFGVFYTLDFITAQLGWALAINRPSCPVLHAGEVPKCQVIAILHTKDGGETWREIAHAVV